MVGHRRIRRALVAAFTTAALLLSGTAGSASAAAAVSTKICDYEWQKGTWHIKQLIRCAARFWNSPGTPEQAVAVAHCESQLEPEAYNANGYAGLYQQATRYWPGRADRWGQPGRSVFNGRANIIVSVRMAAAAGSWSAWAGCG
ncbi:MAG: hypothetical protein ACRDHU_07450 [Actinomycetota bacterium]